MSQYLINQRQFRKLLETAMDLDIYVQGKNFDTNNGNDELQNCLRKSIEMLGEIESHIKYGKSVPTDMKQQFFGIYDSISEFYDKIKFDD